MFVDKYGISMLPVSLFIYGDKELICYDGLINRERFKETLLLLKENNNYLLSKDEINKKLLQIYKEKGI